METDLKLTSQVTTNKIYHGLAIILPGLCVSYHRHHKVSCGLILIIGKRPSIKTHYREQSQLFSTNTTFTTNDDDEKEENDVVRV